MRNIWIGAAAMFAVVGLAAGGVQASTTPTVKSNIIIYSGTPAPKKKDVKAEQKKQQTKRDVQQASARRPCDGFFECLFSTRRAARVSFTSSGVSDRTTRTTVDFTDAKYQPGTIIVRTPERALYYVLPDGQALRYKVGVGRQGFQWSGNSKIAMK